MSINQDQCESTILHQEIIDHVQGHMPPDETAVRMAALLKLFGDPTRVRILFALRTHEMCVCDLSVLLEMTQSAISHQLKGLRLGGLVKNRKEGKVVYYSLADDHVITIFDQALAHIEHLQE